jgi:hypothetical protein
MSLKIFQLFKIIINPSLIPFRRDVGGEQRGILLKEEKKRWILKAMLKQALPYKKIPL